MSKKRKTFINVAKILFICLVVVLGVVIFTNKDTTTMNKNTKKTNIEKLAKNPEKKDFITMKNRIKLKNRLDRSLNKNVLPKNNVKKIRFKKEDKKSNEISSNSKVELEKVEKEEVYTPHRLHNNKNGFVCKNCERKPLSKNQKRAI